MICLVLLEDGGIPGNGMATSAGETSVALDDTLVLVILFLHVARCRPELWSGVRLLARLGPLRECGCRCYLD